MAQKKNGKQGSNLKSFYWILGVIAVVGIAAIAWVVARGKRNIALEPVAVAGADNPQALVEKAKGETIGSDNAPVKMLVFSDYQCPYCGQFASLIEPGLTDQFVKSGKMQFVYYDFPLGGAHKYSFLAARAARCAGDQGKFWEYHNLLFGKQSDWAAEDGMPLKTFLGYGNDVGLDAGQFQSCVKSDKYQDIVSANHELGERLGVNSTPTIYINGRRVPPEMGLDLKGLGDLIDREAAGAPAPAAPAATDSAKQ